LNFLKNYTFIKITLIITFFSFIILSTYLNGVFDKIENSYQKDAEKHNKLLYNQIEKNLLNIKKDLIYISNSYTYFFDNTNYTYKDKLELFSQSFKIMSESRKVYSQIRFIDTQGFEVIRVEYKNSISKIIEKDKLQNKEDRYYFKESLTLNKDEIYLSKFDLNIENGQIDVPYNPTLRLSTPITNKKNEIIGYIVINYLGNELLADLKLHDDINTLFLNIDSYYLLGFKPEDEWAFMFNKNISFQNTYPNIWKEFRKVQGEHSFNTFQNNIHFYMHNINPVEIISPNRKTKSRRDWTIVSYVDHEKILNQFYDFLFSLKYLLIGFGFIILTFAYIISLYVRKINEGNLRIEIANEVFKNTIEGILVLNNKAEIIQVNNAFTHITGYTEEEVFGKNPKILKGKYGQSKDIYVDLWKSILNDNYWNGELINQHKNGEKYISKISIGVIKKNTKIIYYIGVFSDVTKERENTRKLEKNTIALENSLTELKNTQNKLIESKKLAALGQLIAGISHEINSPLGAIKSSSDNILESIKNIIEQVPKLDSILNKEEKELFEKLKSILPFEISLLSIKEQRVLKKEIIKQLDDLGIENSRYFADKFSQFNISDIEPYKTLLNHEKAEFIIDTLFEEYLTVSNIHNIKYSVNRASKIIYSLKKFAHFDHDREGGKENIEDSINNILILFSHNLKQGIEVSKNYGFLSPIFCYSDELSQVWINLISNAIHAMKNSGKLEISTYEDDNYQIVSIKDNGYGIPKEIEEKIFQPFFTTKKSGEGSGLGLDIVKKIVEAHKGKIEFQSDENGTIFTIYLSKNLKEEK
jgi:PAS domain S-box-containing protein